MSGLLRRYLETRSGNPYAEFGNSYPPTNGQIGSYGSSGSVMDENTALSIAAVFTANTILADSISTMPVRQFRGTGDNKKEMDPSQVIAQPYVEITQMDWLTQQQMSLGLRGNAYGLVIERDSVTGWPVQVMPVHPDHARVQRNQTTGALQYTFFSKIVPLDDVIHIRANSVPNQIKGLSPIEILRQSFGMAKSAEAYAAKFYSQSAMPGGILQVQGQPTDEEARTIATQWSQAHGGVSGAFMPAVLPDSVKWQQVTISPADAQFLESRAFSRDEIMGIYRIPPHVYGGVTQDTSASRDLESQEIGFVRNALEPWIRRHEIAMTSLLPRGQYVELDRSKRIEADSLKKAQVHQAYRNVGAITVEEIRRSIGLQPLSDEFKDWAKDPQAPLNSAHSDTSTTAGNGQQNPTDAPTLPDSNPNAK